ncbi:hypothetical protein HK104_007377 [Borealophlyctis nickersoniae]|nr:hypothetical protein HK104_007377 [Borealophlyctis nickersoniae]
MDERQQGFDTVWVSATRTGGGGGGGGVVARAAEGEVLRRRDEPTPSRKEVDNTNNPNVADFFWSRRTHRGGGGGGEPVRDHLGHIHTLRTPLPPPPAPSLSIPLPLHLPSPPSQHSPTPHPPTSTSTPRYARKNPTLFPSDPDVTVARRQQALEFQECLLKQIAEKKAREAEERRREEVQEERLIKGWEADREKGDEGGKGEVEVQGGKGEVEVQMEKDEGLGNGKGKGGLGEGEQVKEAENGKTSGQGDAKEIRSRIPRLRERKESAARKRGAIAVSERRKEVATPPKRGGRGVDAPQRRLGSAGASTPSAAQQIQSPQTTRKQKQRVRFANATPPSKRRTANFNSSINNNTAKHSSTAPPRSWPAGSNVRSSQNPLPPQKSPPHKLQPPPAPPRTLPPLQTPLPAPPAPVAPMAPASIPSVPSRKLTDATPPPPPIHDSPVPILRVPSHKPTEDSSPPPPPSGLHVSPTLPAPPRHPHPPITSPTKPSLSSSAHLRRAALNHLQTFSSLLDEEKRRVAEEIGRVG